MIFNIKFLGQKLPNSEFVAPKFEKKISPKKLHLCRAPDASEWYLETLFCSWLVNGSTVLLPIKPSAVPGAI